MGVSTMVPIMYAPERLSKERAGEVDFRVGMPCNIAWVLKGKGAWEHSGKVAGFDSGQNTSACGARQCGVDFTENAK